MLKRSIIEGVRFDYLLVDSRFTCTELLKALQKSKSVKYSRSIGYYTAAISAKLSGIKINLFFYRKGKNVNWSALLTSDLKLMPRKPSNFTR